MQRDSDKLSNRILQFLEAATEPLETKEIETALKEAMKTKEATRIKILYRLNLLRGDGLLKGKPVGSGKGCWIWWRKDLFGERKKR